MNLITFVSSKNFTIYSFRPAERIEILESIRAENNTERESEKIYERMTELKKKKKKKNLKSRRHQSLKIRNLKNTK